MVKSTGIVDFEAFMQELGLGEEMLSELYLGFMEELEEQRQLLLQRTADKDYDKAAKIIHNIKGISGSYRAIPVFKLSSELNTLFRENRADEAEVSIPQLSEYILATTKEIRKCFITYVSEGQDD